MMTDTKVQDDADVALSIAELKLKTAMIAANTSRRDALAELIAAQIVMEAKKYGHDASNLRMAVFHSVATDLVEKDGYTVDTLHRALWFHFASMEEIMGGEEAGLAAAGLEKAEEPKEKAA